MTRIITLVFMLMLYATSTFAAMRVAVVDFYDNSGAGMNPVVAGVPGAVAVAPVEGVSTYVADHIVERLLAHPDFEVYERNRLNTILNEQGLGMSGVISVDQAIRVGKMAGVKYIITGEITQATIDAVSSFIPYVGSINENIARVSMHVTMIDVETGRIENKIANFSGKKGTKSILGAASYRQSLMFEAADGAINEFMRVLYAKYPVFGTVAEVIDDEQIIVTMGHNLGVHEKSRLAVVREGKPIIVDGQVVAVRRKEIASLKVVEVQEKISVCSGDSTKIKKGDKVTFKFKKK